MSLAIRELYNLVILHVGGTESLISNLWRRCSNKMQSSWAVKFKLVPKSSYERPTSIQADLKEKLGLQTDEERFQHRAREVSDPNG